MFLAAHDRLGEPSNDLWTRDHDLSLATPQTILDALKQVIKRKMTNSDIVRNPLN